jgi:hypothetical protein
MLFAWRRMLMKMNELSWMIKGTGWYSLFLYNHFYRTHNNRKGGSKEEQKKLQRVLEWNEKRCRLSIFKQRGCFILNTKTITTLFHFEEKSQKIFSFDIFPNTLRSTLNRHKYIRKVVKNEQNELIKH